MSFRETMKKNTALFQKFCWNCWWKKVLFLMFLLIVLLFFAGTFLLNFTVKNSITTFGRLVTGTGVELASIDIHPFEGRVVMNQLAVLNPEGYKNREAFQFEKFIIDIDLSTVFSKKIEIEQVELTGMRVDFEITTSGSNLGKLRENIEKIVPPPSEKDAAADADTSGSGVKEPQKLVIRKLSFHDGEITLSSGLLGSKVPVILPGVELENVGDGRSLNESVLLIYDTLFECITKAVTSVGVALPNALMDGIKGIFGK